MGLSRSEKDLTRLILNVGIALVQGYYSVLPDLSVKLSAKVPLKPESEAPFLSLDVDSVLANVH